MRNLLVLCVLLLLLTGCANMKIVPIVDAAEKGALIFEEDFVKLSEVSLQREWMLRRVVSDLVFEMEMIGMGDQLYPSSKIRELVKKYNDLYVSDVMEIEKQRTEHRKSLVNSKIVIELLRSLKNYHSKGVDVDTLSEILTNEAIPVLFDIINKKEGRENDGSN